MAVSAVTPHGLMLTWAGAMDDVSVVGYRVYQDDVLLGMLGGDTTMFEVTGLSPWTDYVFRVAADDQAGNGSVVDLEAAVKTPDEVAPTWMDGALVASDVTPETLLLTWPEATDDVAVTQYRVTLDGEELTTVSGDVTSLQVVDLSPWTEYAFAVTASDAAGAVGRCLALTRDGADAAARLSRSAALLDQRLVRLPNRFGLSFGHRIPSPSRSSSGSSRRRGHRSRRRCPNRHRHRSGSPT